MYLLLLRSILDHPLKIFKSDYLLSADGILLDH